MRIRLTLPFCDTSQEKQTKCSLIFRTMAVGLGVIALLTGVLVLCGIPSLSTLGTTGGSLFSALGVLMILTGAFLRCIKKRDQQDSGHSTQISNTGFQGDSQRISNDIIVDEIQDASTMKCSTFDRMNGRNKKNSIDFAKITPANYEQHLDVSKRLDRKTGKQGDFVFTKGIHDRDFVSSISPYKCKKGDEYLDGEIQHKDKGWYCGGSLEICNGEFIHYPQMSAPSEHFSNLKEFFDYMFRGNFYQGECTRDMEFFALKTIDGKEVRYYNPYGK